MQTLLNFIDTHLQCCYFALAGLFGGIAAWFRAYYNNPGQDWHLRFADAALCAMFSTGLAQIAYGSFNVPLEYSMPLGTFVGYLGAPYVVDLFKIIIKKHLRKIIDLRGTEGSSNDNRPE